MGWLMEYMPLGPTGVNVSRICLGTATFGVAPNERDAERVVHAALDLGINFFDTANVYGHMPTFDRAGRRRRANVNRPSTSSGERSPVGGTRWWSRPSRANRSGRA